MSPEIKHSEGCRKMKEKDFSGKGDFFTPAEVKELKKRKKEIVVPLLEKEMLKGFKVKTLNNEDLMTFKRSDVVLALKEFLWSCRNNLDGANNIGADVIRLEDVEYFTKRHFGVLPSEKKEEGK